MLPTEQVGKRPLFQEVYTGVNDGVRELRAVLSRQPSLKVHQLDVTARRAMKTFLGLRPGALYATRMYRFSISARI